MAIIGQRACARQYRLTVPCHRRLTVLRRPVPVTSTSSAWSAALTRTGPAFPYGQRLGRDARREPAERHVQGMPQPLPCGVRPVLKQLLANVLVVRLPGTGRNPGVDGNKGSVIDAGQLCSVP